MPGEGWDFRQDLISASYPSRDVVLLFLVVEEIVQLVFGSFSAGIISYVVVDLVCLLEEASSGSSYATILDHPLPHPQGSLFDSTTIVVQWNLL